ncbi:MAG: VWA domain-containing protein [Paracoccaceae bacterium]
MTDEDMEKLRQALAKAPPPTDAVRKLQTLARAMDAFDQHQENARDMRPMSDRHEPAGFLTGVRKMFTRFSAHPYLTASASVAAVCVGAVLIAPELRRPTDPQLPLPRQEEPLQSAGAAESAPTADALTDANADAAANPPATEIVIAGIDENDGRAKTADEAMRTTVEAQQEPSLAEDAAASVESYAAGAQPQVVVLEPALSQDSYSPPPAPSTEAFSNEAQNPVKIVSEEPVSTFSIDTDTASWSVIRSSLAYGVLPPKEAVRIEEMINYFPYDYAGPAADEGPFHATLSSFQTPWNRDTEILRIGLQGEMPALEDRPPLNLVFLIDTSGSMDEPNKLPLLQKSFRLMLGQLRPEDRVAIVTYAGSAGLVLEPTAASDRATIIAALDRLGTGGSTAGAEGLQLAYQTAESMAQEGSIARILLATDGDFNVGIDDPAALTDFIAKKRDSGTYLSVLGFGRGNLDDATMQALAQNGNGTAAYIDTLAEAQKVLVDQLTGALFPIANDVKIQIEFNPAAVAEYRLIGYETRALAREDFNNDKVDAGEVGAGHQVTALYEITRVGSPARLSDPLRYGEPPAFSADAAELGFLKLRYKRPGENTSALIETPIPIYDNTAPDDGALFATAIAGMGQLLSGSKYLGTWGWDEAIALASDAKGQDPFGYRAEAVQLMRLAQSLAH